MLLKIYNSLFYPYLVQSIIIWGGVASNKLLPIQVIMNKTLRYILNVQFDNNYRPLMRTDDMYKKLNLLKRVLYD